VLGASASIMGRSSHATGLRPFAFLFVSGGVRIGFVQNPQAALHVNGNIISAHLACSSLSSGGTLQGQALRITGNVGIGVTNPTFRLDVAGSAHATSFPTSSDARFKTNVKELTNVLDKLEKIRAVSFQWNELYESLGRSTGRAEIGVIAQEVEAIFPELVTAWGDESYKGVDYGRLSGVLIEAVKELKAQNEVLRSRIEALEGV
jgi:tetrahydromethanopterin S-methyltransferase subunit G